MFLSSRIKCSDGVFFNELNFIRREISYRNSCERLGFEVLTEPHQSESLNHSDTDVGESNLGVN